MIYMLKINEGEGKEREYKKKLIELNNKLNNIIDYNNKLIINL